MFKFQLYYPFYLLAIVLSLFLLQQRYPICINVTPSMPMGIYVREDGEVHRGDTVAFCLAEPDKTIGINRGYVAKGHICQGTDPLIKQVIAIPGDTVQLTDQSIRVNGVIYGYHTFYADSRHRPLAVYPRGNYAPSHGYWLVGTHSAQSWDSRYYGAISRSQMLYKLKPLWLIG
jgi:signal peptidase I, bacterial type/conjugative transfer signal peptidase TraF